MKIVSIGKYGTMVFDQDGSVKLDNWAVVTDPAADRHVEADELALMLFQYLAGELRDEVLNRIMESCSVQRQAY